MTLTAAIAPPLTLRPGVPVVRRDAQTLQVGLDPPHVACLPDVPEVRHLLAALREGESAGPYDVVALRALAALQHAGLTLPVWAGLPDPAVAAAQAQFGADGVRRLHSRTTAAVGVRAAGRARETVLELLSTAGLRADDGTPSVWLLVADGVLPRDAVDPLTRAGVPHLVVEGSAARRRVGPFVAPGRTACVRCVDAHEAEQDPRRPFLLAQAANDDRPPPLDPVLDRLVLAWAVRDLTRYLEGDRPSTWSTTVDLSPADAPEVVSRLRHPHCGCAWDAMMLDLP